MRRLLLLSLVAAVAAAVPATAPAAACSPLSCAASGTPLGGGLLAVRPTGATGPVDVLDLGTGTYVRHLPGGVLNGRTLVSPEGGRLQWYDAVTGRRTASAPASARVGGRASLVGVSQAGRSAVLQGFDKTTRQTIFTVVSPGSRRTVALPTRNWGFDALDGSNLYLLRYLSNGYQIRSYDLATGRLAAKPLKDPHASSTIWGIAWSRVVSHDGRYLFTLYVGPNGGTMVHQLDLRTRTARCIDLPGTGDFNNAVTYAMELSPDGRTLWAVSPGYGRSVAIDVRAARVRSAFRFTPASDYAEAPSAAVSALSADGKQLAVSVGGKLWLVDTVRGSVTRGKPVNPLALGFAPDGSTLWAATHGEDVLRVPLV
jgi:hypothetical protein